MVKPLLMPNSTVAQLTTIPFQFFVDVKFVQKIRGSYISGIFLPSSSRFNSFNMLNGFLIFLECNCVKKCQIYFSFLYLFSPCAICCLSVTYGKKSVHFFSNPVLLSLLIPCPFDCFFAHCGCLQFLSIMLK